MQNSGTILLTNYQNIRFFEYVFESLESKFRLHGVESSASVRDIQRSRTGGARRRKVTTDRSCALLNLDLFYVIFEGLGGIVTAENL